MKILVAINQAKVRELVAFGLDSQLIGQVINALSAEKALDSALSLEKDDLLVCEYPANFKTIFGRVPVLAQRVPVIVFVPEGETAPDPTQLSGYKLVGIVKGNDALAPLLELVAKFHRDSSKPAASAKKKEEGEEIPRDRFCKVAVMLLQGAGVIPVDLYIQLASGRYLKLFAAGDTFEDKDRQKYLNEKKIQHLYVKAEDSQKLMGAFQAALNQHLSKEGDELKATAAAHEAALEMVARFGMTPEIKSLMKTSMMGAVKSALANPRLKNIIAKLTTDKSRYISSHSVDLSQLACGIAAGIDWGSNSTFHKLTMAAFLHDIVLTDQYLATLQTKADIAKAEQRYSKEALREYIVHPAKSADIARQFEEVPPDVDTVIVQHHERPDGSGFPRGLNRTQIIPLSCLFIIAHDLLSWMFEKGEKFQLEEFLEARKDLYSSGNFRKVFVSLKKS